MLKDMVKVAEFIVEYRVSLVLTTDIYCLLICIMYRYKYKFLRLVIAWRRATGSIYGIFCHLDITIFLFFPGKETSG